MVAEAPLAAAVDPSPRPSPSAPTPPPLCAILHRNNGEGGMQHVGCTTALRFALRSACKLGNTTLLWRALHVFVHTQSISTCASTVRNICASCVLPLEITDLFPLLVAVALMHNGMALPPSRHPNISESPSSTRLQLPGSYSLLSPCTGTQQGQEEGGGEGGARGGGKIKGLPNMARYGAISGLSSTPDAALAFIAISTCSANW